MYFVKGVGSIFFKISLEDEKLQKDFRDLCRNNKLRKGKSRILPLCLIKLDGKG
ncbi:hypothetical protein TTE0440 [Caldanaerobacter subterraneus subsp. tengcongensis MB4]|uniref:Uncharacterized protein n=1 Tax=Caldanaerobacter subterraneus subsp. tengcongensis (strain DSM 15242 / JCM 11007 / NBRC 100824 / MB4) TaxID=273068 RepID=Q8RCI8_CALS4|nr:hypothetical protein TTE0440 [Caldanaerobacter subterraneus subsp. tengcongensis MB4]